MNPPISKCRTLLASVVLLMSDHPKQTIGLALFENPKGFVVVPLQIAAY